VKSGRRKGVLPGIKVFSNALPVRKNLLIGIQGIPVEEFLAIPIERWFE